MASVLLSDCVDRFLAWADFNLRPRTVDVYRLYLNRFVLWAGNVPVDRLSPALLETWSRKFHPVQAVQRLTGWLHRQERSIGLNPLSGMRKIKTGKRRRVLSRIEQVQLLRATDRVFRGLLIALRETYARPQEMRAVTWADIRQAGGELADAAAIAGGTAFFELETGKGFERRADQSRERIIPISPRLGRLLLRLMRIRGSTDAVIFQNRLRRPWSANAVRCRMRRLRLEIGMAPDRRGERVVAYSLRHTGATACAKAGLRDWTLAEVLGHASTRTTARYVHLQAADVVEAMQRVWGLKPGGSPRNDRTGLRTTRPE